MLCYIILYYIVLYYIILYYIILYYIILYYIILYYIILYHTDFNISGWSYPCQVPVEADSRRLTFSLPDGATNSISHLLTSHLVNGVTYIVIDDSHTPTVILYNHCAFSLSYGQTLTAKSEDVLESMSLISVPPSVESHHVAAYTFPTINRKFPSHMAREDYPRLKLAGEVMLLSSSLSSFPDQCI